MPAGARAGHAARELPRAPSPSTEGRALHAGPATAHGHSHVALAGPPAGPPPKAVVEIRVLAGAAQAHAGPLPVGKDPVGWLLEAGVRADGVHKQLHGPAGAVLAEGQAPRQPPGRGAGKGTAPASPLLHQARGEEPRSSPLGKTTGQEAGDIAEKTRSLRSPEHQQDGLRDTGPLSSLQWADHPLIVTPRRERPDGHGAWT